MAIDRDKVTLRNGTALRQRVKGRGAAINPDGRFEPHTREAFDDGWERVGEDAPPFKTTVHEIQARSIISRNDSPDVPFTQSVNPYQGCEHGCIYCYARPTHGYYGLSAGLDFETKLFAKTNAAQVLRAELSKPGYRCELISLGANTDPYQPIERDYRLTRQVLEVLAEFKHPVGIVTKSALVERDIDILAPMAAEGLAHVFMSCTTLDHDVSRYLEPRTSAPRRRIEAIAKLAAAGVPVGMIVAPVIPFLTDTQMESVLEAAYAAGARRASYVLLRLPYEVKDLFKDWLAKHFPLKADHIMSLIRQSREGKENDANFGSRMRGSGLFAEMIRDRFALAAKRVGFNAGRAIALDTSKFRVPDLSGQLRLF
jgi:DNA repair photolyase